jgi:hypothetical protein
MSFRSIDIDSSIISIISSESIRTVEDALVELVTNSIDAYRSTTNKVMIDITTHGHIITIQDWAKGLSLEDFQKRMLVFGSLPNQIGSRGAFGRGAKDIVAITTHTEYTVCHDNKLYTCVLFPDLKYTLSDLTPTDQPNGLKITMHVKDNYIIPTDSQLTNNIWLRDILTKPEYNITYQGHRLLYNFPSFWKLKQDMTIKISEYQLATVNIKVWHSDSPCYIPAQEWEREYGGIISSDTSVYELSSFRLPLQGYNQDYRWNRWAPYLLVQVRCNYIDYLLKDFRQNGPSLQNPCCCLESNRRKGLVRKHPFCVELLKICYDIYQQNLDDIRDMMDAGLIIDTETDFWSELASQAAYYIDNSKKKYNGPTKKSYNFRVKIVHDETDTDPYELVYKQGLVFIRINSACRALSVYPNLSDQQAKLAILNIVESAVIDIKLRFRLNNEGITDITYQHYDIIKKQEQDIRTAIDQQFRKASLQIQKQTDPME